MDPLELDSDLSFLKEFQVSQTRHAEPLMYTITHTLTVRHSQCHTQSLSHTVNVIHSCFPSHCGA